MNAAVVIPCFNPERTLIEYVSALINIGFQSVVVVNDGSASVHDEIFAALSAFPPCTVLHHERNRGKGRALKTGFFHVQTTRPDIAGVIVAYADGRFQPEDVLSVANALVHFSDALILGVRNTADRSLSRFTRFGNRFCSALIRLLYGVKVQDIQTGLRGYPSEMLGKLLTVSGERYEYEINLLLSCIKYALPIQSIPVTSAYYKNSGPWSRHLRSSFVTLLLVIQSFLRFAASSLTSSAVDIGLFAVMTKLVLSKSVPNYIEISTIVARCISASFNFYLNRKFVFVGRNAGKKAAGRFILLSLFQMLASALLVGLLFGLIGIDEVFVKFFVDITLFFIGYQIQHRWIFKKKT